MLEKGYAFYGYFIIVAIMLKNNTESSKKSIICLGTIWQQVRWRRDVTDEFAGAAGTFLQSLPPRLCVRVWVNTEQWTVHWVQRTERMGGKLCLHYAVLKFSEMP